MAEGLLVYLPPEAQDRLFDTITSLSAPGSAVATEYVPGIVDFDAEKGTEMTAKARDQGLDLDMGSLVYSGPRSHVMEYLGAKGWNVTGTPGDELFQRLGLPAPPESGRERQQSVRRNRLRQRHSGLKPSHSRLVPVSARSP